MTLRPPVRHFMIESIKRVISFRPIAFALVLSLMFLVASEENESGPTHLQVYVYGTLSGKQRENIQVNLYYSQGEAEAQINPVTPQQNTDLNGLTAFYNIAPGTRFWVRADALLSKK